MVTYAAPLDDFRFLLNEVLDYEATVASLPGCEEATGELLEAVLEEGAKFCENELLPLNQSGDEEGCVFENGVVRTPKGFKKAYQAFCEGGCPTPCSSFSTSWSARPTSASACTRA